MSNLSPSVIEDIERASYEIARRSSEYFYDWKAGKVYIPMSALRAMGRRYLYLRDTDNLLPLEVYEYGALFAFFSLMYPPDGEIPTVAGMAIDFCNLLVMREQLPSPTE
jgi:hypothetical protein